MWQNQESENAESPLSLISHLNERTEIYKSCKGLQDGKWRIP